MSRYQFIDGERTRYSVRRLCQVLGVAPSRYYAWCAARQGAPAVAPLPAWDQALVKTFARHKRRYGTRRLRVALRQQGYCVGRQALRTALRRHGLRALQPAAFTPRTTDSTHGRRCAPNLLLDQARPGRANQVWVSDITYLPLASGEWAYLCAFQDACSKRVVGYHVLATMPEELVTTALRRALHAEAPAPGLVVHADRGGQYCATSYRALLAEHSCRWSQSRRGECYDNAQAESLWSRLKTEVLEVRERPVFADLTDAQTSIAAYFDYYNYERLHSALNYRTPHLAHQQLLLTTALNCPD